jgi:hypothetical protein
MPKQDAIIQIINVNLEILHELLGDKTYTTPDGQVTDKALLDFSREHSLINDIETLLMQLQ